MQGLEFALIAGRMLEVIQESSSELLSPLKKQFLPSNLLQRRRGHSVAGPYGHLAAAISAEWSVAGAVDSAARHAVRRSRR